MHMTSVLFLVQFNNFAPTTGFYWSSTLLLKSPALICALDMIIGLLSSVLAVQNSTQYSN